MDSFSSIPVMSMAPWRGASDERRAFVDELRRACHEVGFFLLVDHGIEREWFDDYFALVRRFFALPDDVKARIEKIGSAHFRGWERIGSELTDNKVDFREQVDCSTEWQPYPNGVEPAYLRIDGPNQWLPEDVLPGFRTGVLDFMARMGAIADQLMRALATSLDLPDDTFHVRFGERPHSLTKLISYPPTPRGMAGVNSHHDAGFLTLLVQNGVSGLQAQNPDGDWIDVPPTPGTLVVNLGEMLQSMTGNYYVATTHRVIATDPRLSVAYFHGPDLRAGLAPLELGPEFRRAVERSPRHRSAGFMATRDDLLAGESGTRAASAGVFGQQLWNYYCRSYPANVKRHHPDVFSGV
ncbi:MAG: isopenicillin N synthase family dioxygenase [Ilumatobacteraceae bacterium]